MIQFKQIFKLFDDFKDFDQIEVNEASVATPIRLNSYTKLAQQN
jgi:hypothetical protein